MQKLDIGIRHNEQQERDDTSLPDPYYPHKRIINSVYYD